MWKENRSEGTCFYSLLKILVVSFNVSLEIFLNGPHIDQEAQMKQEHFCTFIYWTKKIDLALVIDGEGVIICSKMCYIVGYGLLVI